MGSIAASIKHAKFLGWVGLLTKAVPCVKLLAV